MCCFIFYLFCILHAILLVIPPEVVMEVEARMNRNYMPPILPSRKHSRHPVKPHLPTVQELQGRSKCFYTFKGQHKLTSIILSDRKCSTLFIFFVLHNIKTNTDKILKKFIKFFSRHIIFYFYFYIVVVCSIFFVFVNKWASPLKNI